jgi:uncharacterized membrane protein
MGAKHLLGVASAAAAAIGTALLLATGAFAEALGADGGVVRGSGSVPAVSFWFQLAFMRLFATALLGLSAILLWSRWNLAPEQQRSLVSLLGVVFALMALMAMLQQVAVWGTPAGWVLAGVLGTIAVACALSSRLVAVRRAA